MANSLTRPTNRRIQLRSVGSFDAEQAVNERRCILGIDPGLDAPVMAQ